jgi:hypothetical protein
MCQLSSSLKKLGTDAQIQANREKKEQSTDRQHSDSAASIVSAGSTDHLLS